MKRLLLILILLLGGWGTSIAQSGSVRLAIEGGDNALFGGFGALSIEAEQQFKSLFQVRGGLQYNTIQRTAAEVRPALFYDLNFGRLHAEFLLHYTRQSRINTRALGGGFGLTTRYLWLTLGYYHRTIWQGDFALREPLNIYYELGINCLPGIPKWDLQVIFSNSRLFELERHYQPSLHLHGWWYPFERMGFGIGAAYKPAGIFNIASDYYQLYGTIGFQYKW